MVSKTPARRLERLAARETPNSPRVLKILVTRVGGPDRTIELVINEPNDLRRGFWQSNREGDR
jgi:hypothetical protein